VVDTYIEEIVSSTKKVENRKLGKKRYAYPHSVYLRTNRGGTLNKHYMRFYELTIFQSRESSFILLSRSIDVLDLTIIPSNPILIESSKFAG